MNLDYLGGLFDGEGSASMSKRISKGRVSLDPQIAIAMTNRETIEEILFTLKFGTVRERIEKRENHRNCWEWNCKSQEEVSKFCSLLGQFVWLKRHHLMNLQQFCESRGSHRGRSRPYTETEMACYFNLKELNQRGKKNVNTNS